MEPGADVLVVWICGQVSRGGIARVVVSKNETAACRQIVVAIFESDDAGTQLKNFLEVEYRPIGKRLGSFYDSCYGRAVFISEGV